MIRAKHGPSSRRRAELERQYDLLWGRHLQQEGKLWPTPALALGALAFLFSIALGPGATDLARIVAGSLALVVSAASLQLMSKQYHVGNAQRVKLRQIEEELGLEAFAGDAWNTSTWRAERGVDPGAHVRLMSRLVWQTLLVIFGLCAAGVVVVTALWPHLL